MIEPGGTRTSPVVSGGGRLLEVEDLRTVFHTRAGVLCAVDGVSFHLDRGEVFSVVGESGSGKSVTAMSIMRLIGYPGEIVGGSIEFNGRNLLDLKERDMRNVRGSEISMIFQDPMTALNPVYEIGYQISEPLRRHRGLSRKDARDAAVDALRRVGIPDAQKRIKDRPHQFSGGMRQRAMIAMAMITDPLLLIADEPTTALDVTIQAQILDLILEISDEHGTAVMLISHDLGVVANVSDRMAVMYGGQIHESGSARDVFEDPFGPYTWGLMAAVPRLDTDLGATLRHIPGQPPSLIEVPTGCRFSPRCEYAENRCETSLPRLDLVAPGHTVRCHLADSEGWTRVRTVAIARDRSSG